MFKTNINIYFLYPSNRKTIKAWFPYDHNDRSTTIAKIAECMVPYARKDRSDRCDHMETGFNRFAITRIKEVNVYVCFKHFVS